MHVLTLSSIIIGGAQTKYKELQQTRPLTRMEVKVCGYLEQNN